MDTDSRERFLQAGQSLLLRVGFTAAGLSEIINEANAPKGSFYHHFKSKEEFALQVLERYGEEFSAITRRHLGNARKKPLARLKSYFEALIEVNERAGWMEGCLLGGLGQELGSQNERLRRAIEVGFRLWRASLEECLREAQEAGELNAALSPQALADFCLNSWEGALLQMKVRQSRQPLDHFLSVMFQVALRP